MVLILAPICQSALAPAEVLVALLSEVSCRLRMMLIVQMLCLENLCLKVVEVDWSIRLEVVVVCSPQDQKSFCAVLVVFVVPCLLVLV